jgi:transposase-like protein
MSDEMVEKRTWAILQVRSGQMTVQEAADAMGVSRKTYYEWEKKALSAMTTSLLDGDAGRPENPTDPEKEALKKEVARLKQELTVARESLHVRRVLDAYAEKLNSDEKKKLKKKV